MQLNQVIFTITDATPELLQDIDQLIRDHKSAKTKEPVKPRDIHEPTINEHGVKTWTNEEGLVDRKTGPAIEHPNGDYEWWIDGQRGRNTDVTCPTTKCSHMYYWFYKDEEFAAYNSSTKRFWITGDKVPKHQRTFSFPN